MRLEEEDALWLAERLAHEAVHQVDQDRRSRDVGTLEPWWDELQDQLRMRIASALLQQRWPAERALGPTR